MVSFRPTATQALGRGAYRGALGGMIVAGVVAVLALIGLRVTPTWLAIVAPLVLGVAGGGAIGPLTFRSEGEDIDDVGIHSASSLGTLACTPWRRIADVRPERRSGRTLVAVYFDTGQVARLRAPYDGRWLGADPEFERKLFLLRNQWETHRSYAVRSHAIRSDAVRSDAVRSGAVINRFPADG